MSKYFYSFLIIVFLFSFTVVYGQCPSANFSVQQPVCAGQAINFTNTSTNATTYCWDFCSGDFDSLEYTKDDTAIFNAPISTSPVFDGTNWYLFIVNDGTRTIDRLDYGNSLSNIPTRTPIGDPGNTLAGGAFLRTNIVFHKEGGLWYGLLSHFSNKTIIKIDFGSSLANNSPTATVILTDASLDGAFYATLVTDHDSIYLFAGNLQANHVSLIQFGTSINNTPSISSITFPDVVAEVAVVKICNQWKGLAPMFNSSSLYFLDFGTSLSSTPILTDLQTTAIAQPMSLQLGFDGKSWMAFVQNFSPNSITKFDFGKNFTTSYTPSIMIPTGQLGLGRNISLAKENSDFYLFGCSSANNIINYSKFKTNCTTSTTVDTTANPPSIIYSKGGTYLVSLQAIDANGNTSYFTDSVKVNYLPNIGFSINGNCFGDSTFFTDTSKVVNSLPAAWKWHFGDGDSSTLQNPHHFYPSANSYTVTLTTTASTGCANTDSQVVVISPKPIANYNIPVGCSGYPITFTDLSTISSGSITNRLWDFGNTDTSNFQNPSYTYANGGIYPVTLHVTSDVGCQDSIMRLVNVKPSPDALFSVSNTCVGQVVSFHDSTISQAPVASYQWDFGDGNSDTSQNPTHSYSTSIPSVDTVTFIVQANNGCSDTLITPIKINNVPTASFSYLPANACEGNNVTFSDLSSVSGDTISSWSWDFGDSNSGASQNPVHQYAAPGTYTVKLVAYSPSSCPSAVDSQIVTVIKSPTADFSTSNVCHGEAVLLADSSVAPGGDFIQSWHWNFDDGDTSSSQNPSHTFSTSGYHKIILTVTSGFGCTNSYTDSVIVHAPPTATFNYQNPCSSYPTLFFSTSTADSASTIASYQWDFGDLTTSNDTSTFKNPTYTYDTNSVGPHYVFLITTNNFGCSDTALQTVVIKRSIRAAFTSSPTCKGDYMIFTNLSDNKNLDSLWIWTFGDNSGTNLLESPAHYYVNEGSYHVILTAITKGGCTSTASKDVNVSPIPNANFISAPACINNQYQFLDNSTISTGSIKRWDWVISSLASFDSIKNPVYTFDSLKTYPVKLTVTSDVGCKDTVTKNITVHPLPAPDFTFTPQFGLPPLSVSFGNLTIPSSCTYQWDFGDGTSINTATNPSHIYNDTGKFVINLISTSTFGCSDSASKNIYVIKPLLDIAVTDISATRSGNQLTVSAMIANYGTINIDSVIMQARLEDGTSIDEMRRQVLPYGGNGIQSYEFVAKFNISPSARISYFCITAIKPNNREDDVPANNEKCSSLISEMSLFEPYPNPFTNQLHLDVILPFNDPLTVELFSNLGQKINTLYEGPGTTGLNQVIADLSSLPEAIYTLRFTFRDQVIVRQVMKVSVKN